MLHELKNSINQLKDLCYTESNNAGWHLKTREVGTMLMLIVSEISEAMEGYRKGLMDDHLPTRSMIECELADAVIRIGDLAGMLQIDLGGAVIDKIIYNRTRADHKPENRAKKGGKKF